MSRPVSAPEDPSPQNQRTAGKPSGPPVAARRGLSSAAASELLRRHGPNVLREAAHGHPLAIFVRQISSPLVLILLAAAGLSFALGEVTEALIIAAIVLASSGLGFYQEYRASRAMDALRARLAVTARVLRDGQPRDVDAAVIVPGDLLLLAAGSLVAADADLIEATDLHVDEAALTGESFPIEKTAAKDRADDTHRVFMGTSIRSGTALARVTATARLTRFGAIAHAAEKPEPETSFAAGVRRFGILMTQIMIVIIGLVLPINILLGRPLLESVLFSAALAVGLTPELLPAVVTVTLARGAQKLAAIGVLIKRLVVIENLGAMNVLCTDKTGTITEGNVRLHLACDTNGEPSAETLKWAVLNARFQTGLPNPMDAAIVAARAAPGLEGYAKQGEVPYDFERKRLSVLVSGPEGRMLVCKGACASLLPLCGTLREARESVPMTPVRRKAEEARVAAWNGEGYRVLALAIRPLPGPASPRRADEDELTLIGYLLFADPLKEGIAQTVAALAARGVALKIITGDSRDVAAHIAAEAGLHGHHVLTGSQLARLGGRALAHRAMATHIFAEVTPDQKERIVTALRRAGRVVGYMGDGVNDAPALRAADVGISIDTALDVAREAADVVLTRRDLAVLLDGIVTGRTAFANTLKYIAITTSANLGNMVSMAAASLFLPFLPLLAKQILLNNFLSDIPLLAISTDPVDAEVLERPGQWDFGKLVRSMVAFGLLSSLFDGLTFLLLLRVGQANPAIFQTGWFIESLLTELAIVASMRTAKPFYRSTPSRILVGTSLIVALVAIALPYTPLAGLIGFTPLPATLLFALLGLTLAYFALSEVLKPRLGALVPVAPHEAKHKGPPSRGRRPDD